jgi:ankyrin repeat protein
MKTFLPILLRHSAILRLAPVTLVALACGGLAYAQPPSPGFSVNSAGWTPLHEAVLGGKFSVAESLLAKHTQVDSKDASGGTPLHVAAWRGSTNLVELLLNHKADVIATNNFGETPLLAFVLPKIT